MTVNQPAPGSKRRSARARVLLSATLKYPDRVLPVLLRNLSENGALVEAEGLVDTDCKCRLRRKELGVEGHVAWIDGNFAGIAFTDALSPEAAMEDVPRSADRGTNEAVHHRPGFARRAMSTQERRWLEEMSRK